MCFGAASWQSTAPHAPLPTHTFRQHLRKCAENRFRTSFGCLFCGYAGGASTTQTHSEPIRKGGSKAPPPNATADRSGASLAIWRLSLVIYSSAPASQAKNGPTNKKPRQGHQPLKRQPSMEEKNATFKKRCLRHHSHIQNCVRAAIEPTHWPHFKANENYTRW